MYKTLSRESSYLWVSFIKPYFIYSQRLQNVLDLLMLVDEFIIDDKNIS